VSRLVAVVRLLALTALLFSASIFVGLGIAKLYGFQSLTVMSGSMEPRIHVGDLVFDRSVAPLRTKPGDVITFLDPEDNSRLITHRVRSRKLVGAKVRFVTKGDANTGVERWNIDVGGKVGVVSYRVVGAGYALVWLRSPFGRLLCLILPGLVVGGSLIHRLWWPAEKELEREFA
jgi:signal peptidase